MFWKLRKILGDRRGATAVEYGLILSLVVLAMIGALQAFAGEAINMWTGVSDRVEDASN
jgi:pilus assembly protein Flp/PilA